jgi:hypothetical protein
MPLRRQHGLCLLSLLSGGEALVMRASSKMLLTMPQEYSERHNSNQSSGFIAQFHSFHLHTLE